MVASAVSMAARRQGIYALLETALPGRTPHPIGILLIEVATGRGWLKLRQSFDGIADQEDAEVLSNLETHLHDQLAALGGEGLLQWLEDSFSNAVRVTAREPVSVDAFSRAVSQLYNEHVEAVAVLRFETHLPVYTLRAAAGRLGEEMPVDAEAWIPAPEGMKLTSDLFVAHVVGHSMEPRIPDGSLNLFRLKPAGSRQGKILLIERFGSIDETARYTVKRYTSQKRHDPQDGEDNWEHTRIRLEPLNPAFEPWDVQPHDFAVVAEWLRVIE